MNVHQSAEYSDPVLYSAFHFNAKQTHFKAFTRSEGIVILPNKEVISRHKPQLAFIAPLMWTTVLE